MVAVLLAGQGAGSFRGAPFRLPFSGWTALCLRVPVVRGVNAFGGPFESSGWRVLSISRIYLGVSTLRIYRISGTAVSRCGIENSAQPFGMRPLRASGPMSS